MPRINYQGITVVCKRGERLREVLLKNGLTPHNKMARFFNCHGFGTCGTCAVKITGGNVSLMNKREKWRLNFPPHQLENGLRLACQTKVYGDIAIEKGEGFWGQKLTGE